MVSAGEPLAGHTLSSPVDVCEAKQAVQDATAHDTGGQLSWSVSFFFRCHM